MSEKLLKELTLFDEQGKTSITPYDNPHPLIELFRETSNEDKSVRQYHALIRLDGQTLHLCHYEKYVLIGEAAKHLQLLAQTEE